MGDVNSHAQADWLLDPSCGT